MTLPTIVDASYEATVRDFLKVKSDRSGSARIYNGVVSVPTGSAATTIVGLIPFNRGARFHLDGNSVHVADIGAGTTTISLGFIYNDNVTFTNNQTAWASASTAIQAGGFVALTAGVAGLQFVAAADGWVVATINTAATDATGDITFQIVGTYDGLGVDNQNNQS
jgi:hypothetical protein